MSQEPETIVANQSKVNKHKIHPEQDLEAEGQCRAFIPNKNRYCKLTAKTGFFYCGEHRIHDKEGNVKRVVCPNKCNSTFGLWEIERHLSLHCPFRAKVEEPYFSLGINEGGAVGCSMDVDERLSKYRMTLEDFERAKEKIDKAWIELGSPSFQTLIKSHTIMDQFVDDCVTGKHAKQNSSILGNLRDLDLLEDPQSCFQEWGCGKAEVTRWIALALLSRGERPAYSLLIDRHQSKLKLDKVFKQNRYQRVLIDIKDLDLAKVEGSLEYPAIAYSKHLCGSATDMTLRCLQTFQSNGGTIKGVFIATCCHQICTFSRYVNPVFLRNHGIDEGIFKAFRKISTWGVCGQRPQERAADNEEQHWTCLNFEEREDLGLKAKRILDLGRLEFIKNEMGATSAGLIHYIGKDSTLENAAVWAKF